MVDDHRTAHILVYDSGLGGLSVLAEIRALLPGVRTSYLSDSEGFPYGNKSAQFVIDRCHRVLAAFTRNTTDPVDVMVIACNTASTLALPSLRQRFSMPIVGVVPAIKPAAMLSQSRYIGLLATPATVKRGYTRGLIEQFAKSCHVVTCGSTALVHQAEQKLRGVAPQAQQTALAIARLLRRSPANPTPENLDVVVLACTHFPLLRDELAALLGPSVVLLDSGSAIARRVQFCLGELPLGTSSHAPNPTASAWFTGNTDRSTSLSRAFKSYGLDGVRLLSL